MNPCNRVICKVPGSTSNCGSGFDTLGLALSIYNTVTVERDGVELEERGELGLNILTDSSMAQDTVRRFFSEAGIEPFEVRVRITGEVPRARGLGSSVTVRGGILGGLARLAGYDLSKKREVELITELEGHPDNASASILGGFTVSRFVSDPAVHHHTARFEIGENLRFVVVSPEFEVLTSSSRGILPESLSFADAVSSMNNATSMVAALASGRYSQLKDVIGDSFHEPYRMKSIPGAAEAIHAGIRAGAYTGWLSGSGSSVLCACSESEATGVVEAMTEAFSLAGLASVPRDLSADNQGIRIMDTD